QKPCQDQGKRMINGLTVRTSPSNIRFPSRREIPPHHTRKLLE
ncbi:MAG: hypothetical protein ACI9NC_002781, partial [Verrucomicrobiales bacterium]